MRAGNAWESAKDALSNRDPIQMDDIGDVDDAAPVADAGGADAGGAAAADAGFATRASNLGGRLSSLQSRLQGAGDTPPPRPTAPKPTEDAPELPDPATKPSPARISRTRNSSSGRRRGRNILSKFRRWFNHWHRSLIRNIRGDWGWCSTWIDIRGSRCGISIKER